LRRIFPANLKRAVVVFRKSFSRQEENIRVHEVIVDRQFLEANNTGHVVSQLIVPRANPRCTNSESQRSTV